MVLRYDIAPVVVGFLRYGISIVIGMILGMSLNTVVSCFCCVQSIAIRISLYTPASDLHSGK